MRRFLAALAVTVVASLGFAGSALPAIAAPKTKPTTTTTPQHHKKKHHHKKHHHKKHNTGGNGSHHGKK